MKIIFIQPSIGKFTDRPYVKTWQMQPLAIAVLAAMTPPEVEIQFIDDRFDVIPDNIQADMVAIPVETYTAQRAYHISKIIRLKQIPVVMGGIHAALLPQEVAEHADAVVTAGAENVWQQLIHDLQKKQLKKFYSNLDLQTHLTHIAPARHIFKGKPYLPLEMVETGRGCPFSCDFCAIAGAHQKKYRSKRIDDIVNDVASLKGKFLYFVDDNFVSQFKRTKELCDALAPLKKRWFSHGSINMAQDLDLLKRLEKSGCTNILIGFESLNPVTLAAMGKTWNVIKRSYQEAIMRLRDHGISIYGTFVFGYDTEGLDDIDRALEFAIEQKLALAAFNHLVPFPATPLYDRLRKENRLFEEKWWLRPGYRFGEVAFRPKNYSAEILGEKCYLARKAFYQHSCTFKRLLDLKTHCKSLMDILIFLSANFSSKRGIAERQSWPIGDVLTSNMENGLTEVARI